MDLINMVDHSFAKADNLESKLTDAVMNIPGMTSVKIKHFLNNLCSYEGVHYLEIGTHRGGTLTAAMFQNTHNLFVGIDDFSDFDDGTVYRDLKDNLAKFNLQPIFINAGCWFHETIAICPTGINIYFYDGGHGLEEQFWSLELYLHKLDRQFIFIVDDWNWQDSRDGTMKAIKDLCLDILYCKTVFTPDNGCSDTWWNGLGIFVLEKGFNHG